MFRSHLFFFPFRFHTSITIVIVVSFIDHRPAFLELSEIIDGLYTSYNINLTDVQCIAPKYNRVRCLQVTYWASAAVYKDVHYSILLTITLML